jgi:hypothetical protein
VWPAGTKRYAFPNGVTFAVDHAGRYCQTTFPDGAYVPAAPEPGDEQARLAADLGYPSVWPLVWGHEFLHGWQALPGVSRVLWDVAHGRPGDTPEHWDEEGRVLELQRAVCAGRVGAELAAVLAGLSETEVQS